jgi:tetratricopeptide (TPR) repeat protein
MPRRHLDAKLFDKLLRDGELTAAEKRELAWHLLDACPDCAEVADVEWQLAGEDQAPAEPLRGRQIPAVRVSEGKGALCSPAGDSDEPISFDRIHERMATSMSDLFQQKDEAPALLEELLSYPEKRQRLLVRNNPRFQTIPLVELWLNRVSDVGLDEPEAAEETTEIVLELIDATEPAAMGHEILEDLRGRAWAFRGNFRRIRGDFRGAAQAFQAAQDHLERGTGDLWETARLYGLKSTLFRRQGRLDEARELIQKAIAIYLATEELHLAGRAMISQANLLNAQGHPDQAIRVLKDALGMIDSEREPHLLLVGQQNLVAFLNELGRNEEALALLPKVRRQSVEAGSRFDLLRFRWLEGKILLGLGHASRAEAAFLEVRKGFTELEVGYDVAAVSLELAALYLRQGRTAEIKQIAAEMVPLFESRDVHQEVIAALILFKRAVEMETLTARMVEEVSNVIERSRTRPRPRIEEPS